ncbi:zinc finger and SCAN domain-containing protein 12 isoform X13 [Cryptotermes secundus]|uniref:zinc finger and SCAN domain-containing protein 12 isoform X13 n=1 Tax=Cryptotermes secundus TaxID=105785 RepID=UPI001454D0B0|nr:zinc finger and SCAN domain-containing protein 12 isoform X13 [Cryptotermes secundus]
MSSLNYMELCRLCLVKERVSIPIFEGEGNVRQIFLKIASCLPVKVARDDKLPKKICSDCMYKLDNAYQFWNTTANAEKQLLQWLGEIASDDKKSVPSNTIETEQLVLKEEAVEQDQGSELAKGLSRVEAVLADDCKGGSEDEDESESEDEGSNSEDSGEDDGGEAPSKEEAESDEEPYGPLEPTTFVNVSLAGCDEAGPSGMQQQQQEQQQQEQQHHQQEQQQGPQQSQSLQQVQQSSQSQFLTPGAPSTSTAAPTSASGCSTEAFSQGVTEQKKRDKNKRLSRRDKLVKKAKHFITCELCLKDGPKHEVGSHSCLHLEQLSPITRIEIEPISPDYGMVFRCPDCNKMFESGELLAAHMTAHKDSYPYSCHVCSDKFRTSMGLKKHKKVHTVEKSHKHLFSNMAVDIDKGFKCNICGKTYDCSRYLYLHKRQDHNCLPSHKCTMCSKSFLSHSALLAHQSSHIGDRSFRCNTCGYTFCYKRSLSAHMKIYHPEAVKELVSQDVNGNQCEFCGKMFSYKCSLRRHMNLHTRAETYTCDVCGKSFSTRDHLKYHCKRHTGDRSYTCDVCEKAFIKSGDLRQHQRTHTGERPYKCELCEKAFTQRSTLTIHKRLHTGERPYKCDVCDHDFVCKALLTVHQKTHKKCSKTLTK